MKILFKFLILVAGILAPWLQAFAQNVHEATVKYNKQDENAVVGEYGYSKDNVEAALRERLAKEGLTKIRSSKGFLYCSGVVWPSVSNDKIDVYFKVEGNKKKATLSVLVSKGYDNFVSSNTDARTIENLKSFLNSFGEQVNAYQVAVAAREQEKAIKKAEEEHKEAAEKQQKMKDQQKKLAEQQEKWEKEQAEKQKKLEAEKQKLSEIKSQAN